MNDFKAFEDALIDDDFPIQEKPVFNIPKDVDVPTEYQLRAKAMREMETANYEMIRNVASTKSSLLEQLTDIYLNTSNADRQSIREYLKVIKRWRDVFHWWLPNSLMIREPARFLRLRLATLSMLDGDYDFRDTLVALATTWHTIEELEVDPEPYYREALTWGGQLVEHARDMLDPERRRACCFKCLTGKPHLENA